MLSATVSMNSTVEEESNAVVAVQHLVRALEANKNLTDDMKKILADLETKLSSMTVLSKNQEGENSEIEEQLNLVEVKVMNWEADQSMIWDCGPKEASDYLHAVDEVRRLTESLGSSSFNKHGEENKLLSRAYNVLQMAMTRLEDEFIYILVQNKQPFEPEHLSFRSSEDPDEELNIPVEEEPVDNVRDKSDDFILDLVNQDVVPDLKSIANAMFASNYDQECCQAYISIRKDALDECLFILEVEKLSIEDVLRTEWDSLDSMIKKWIRAMKIFVRVYLASEKQLCNQIFGEFESVNLTCFVETSKASILQLLNFGEAISIGTRLPEKLFRILDMYEVLTDLLPDIDSLFSHEVGSSVKIECDEVLRRLGDSVRGTFVEFKNAVRSNASTTPFAGGGVHHLTKYVMNYIKFLSDYSDTLNLLIENQNGEGHLPSLNMNPITEEENIGESYSYSVSSLAHHLREVATILEMNLDTKSKLYRDGALQHLFLMNNIYYMVQKVRDSELRALFGDNWIKQHNRTFQKQAMSYERSTWTSILSLLKDDGIYIPGSNLVSKTVLKERLKTFNLAFEEVYKSQTGWLISDLQLREDLRISISLRLIQAYRAFYRHANNTDLGRQSDKYIKYTADDLQNHLLDFFEGSPRSLQNPRKR